MKSQIKAIISKYQFRKNSRRGDTPIHEIKRIIGAEKKITNYCAKFNIEMPFAQMVWLFVNPKKTPHCDCGNVRAFNNVYEGYCNYCRKCYSVHRLRFTMKSLNNELTKRKKNIRVTEEFKSMSIPIGVQCIKCGYETKQFPGAMLKINGTGCKKCHDRKLTKSHSDYLCDLKGYPIQPLETYQTAKKKIMHSDKRCGHKWSARPNDILTGFGCPFCNTGGQLGNSGKRTSLKGMTFSSKTEAKFAKFLMERFSLEDIEFQKRYRPNNLDRRTCDFYIKSLDLWIEVTGGYEQKKWYVEKILRKRRLVKNFFFATRIEDLEDFLTRSLSSSTNSTHDVVQ